ncbi:zinc finger protein 181-like isoform X2 [Cydia fagiglandana]|uniref:zinc finger protein 181-like isoform X2 n=1 Tax=Cydia fagiglandana TaxID=1458189 RepID=UPI002FEE003F
MKTRSRTRVGANTMKAGDETAPKTKTTKPKGSRLHLLYQPDENPLVVPKVIRQYTRKKKVESADSVNKLASTTSISVAAALEDQNNSVHLVDNHVKIKEEIMESFHDIEIMDVDVEIENHVKTEERSESQNGVTAEDNYVKIKEENTVPNANESVMNNDVSMNSNLSETVQETAKIIIKIEPENYLQYMNSEQKHIDGFRTDCSQSEEDIAVEINPKPEEINCNNVNGKMESIYSEKNNVQGKNSQELAPILKQWQTLNVPQKKILITEEIHIKEEAISDTEDCVEVKDKTPVTTSSIEVKDTTPITASSIELKSKPPVVTSSIEVKHKTPVTTSSNEVKPETPVTTSSIKAKHKTPVTTSNIEVKHKTRVTTSSIKVKTKTTVSTSSIEVKQNTPITASSIGLKDKTAVATSSIEVKDMSPVVIKKNPLPEKIKIRRIMNMPKILKTYGRKQPDPVAMKKCFLLPVINPPAKILRIVSQKFPKTKAQANPKYICDMCKGKFRSKASMSAHMRFSHGVVMKHMCVVCSASFPHHYLMLAHWRAHAGPPLECDLCPKSFQSKDKYGEHLNTHLRERLFPCPVCLQRYPVLLHLQRHAEKHTQEDTFSCNICKETYRSLIDLRRHSERDHGEKEEFPCYICSRILSSNADFLTHVSTHDNAFHACAFCPSKFTDAQKWEEHSAEHIEKIGRGESIEKPYSCEYCKKSFEYQSVLKTHIRMHTGERPYECPECKKKLKTQSSLTEHVNGHKRPYPCPECKQRFGKRNSLSRHMLLHTGERPHSCTGCPMTFVQRSSMLLHMRRFHEPGLKRVRKNKKGAKKTNKKKDC